MLDGIARVDPLMDAAARRGDDIGYMPAIAITDHGNMHGAIECYEAAKRHGLKMITGTEFYVAARSMDIKDTREDRSGFHQTVLVANEIGYNNIITLNTEASLRGFYGKPRIDKELLEKHGEGLIILSGCLSAELPRLLLQADSPDHPSFKKALALADRYKQSFPGRYYLEYQDHGLPEQTLVNRRLARVARILDLPVVITNDVHYIAKDDAPAQEVMICVQTGKTLDDPQRMKMESHEFYLKTAAEMWERWGEECPEGLTNTLVIAEQCTLDLGKRLGKPNLPDVAVPAGHTQQSYLTEVCHARLATRYPAVTAEMTERLDYELSVIKKTGFASYFLLLEDIISHARNQHIDVGPGRGSAVASLASYCLGITNVDPLAFDLLFERFLNPDRNSMPDIDTDFADDRRAEVIRYITARFGADCVAQVSTFGTMAAKGAIKDVGRALGMAFNDVERITKLIPDRLPDKGKVTITDSLEAVEELGRLYAEDLSVTRLIDMARKVENVKRHASVHAAGVVILRDPLAQSIPLCRVGKGGDEGQASQYPFEILDKLGFLKLDALGLTTLTLMRRALDSLERETGVHMEIDDIPLDDPETYALLSRGETGGLFQVEGAAMRKVLRDMKPTGIRDVQAAVALYRPGPMAFIPQYIARKNGSEAISYLPDDLSLYLPNGETDLAAILGEQEMITLRQQATADAFPLTESDGAEAPAEVPLEVLRDTVVARACALGKTDDLTRLFATHRRDAEASEAGERAALSDILGQFLVEEVKQRVGPRQIMDLRSIIGDEEYAALEEVIRPILEKTYGVVTYQDQVLQLALQLAGMRWGDVDKLRKAMGKKIHAVMVQQKQAFFEGFRQTTKWVYQTGEDGLPTAVAVPKPAYPIVVAAALWEQIVTFSGYGFNGAHAAAYATVAAQTAWIKAHHPVHFQAAWLSVDTGTPDRMAVALAECRRMGIEILLPDVNRSAADFMVEGDSSIRFGLGAVRNVGVGAIAGIVSERVAHGVYADLDDFCARADWEWLNKKALESLIKAGALDAFESRSLLIGNLDRLSGSHRAETKAREAGQMSLLSMLDSDDRAQLESVTRALQPAREVPEKERLAWEREMLGVYISDHPLSAYQEAIEGAGATSLALLDAEQAGQPFIAAAQIVGIRVVQTKKNETMAILTVEDAYRTLEAVIFPKTYRRLGKVIEDGMLVILSGTVDPRDERLQLIVDDASPIDDYLANVAS